MERVRARSASGSSPRATRPRISRARRRAWSAVMSPWRPMTSRRLGAFRLRLQPGPPCHRLVDARDLARVERLAQLSAAQRTKQPPPGYAAPHQPLLHHRHAVAHEVEHGAAALGVGLAVAHQDGGCAVVLDRQIRHLQGGQLRTAQQRVVRDGHERTVAGIDQPVSGRFEQALPKRPGEAQRLRLAASPAAVHTLQREPYRRAPYRLCAADRPVRHGDARDVAADRALQP